MQGQEQFRNTFELSESISVEFCDPNGNLHAIFGEPVKWDASDYITIQEENGCIVTISSHNITNIQGS